MRVVLASRAPLVLALLALAALAGCYGQTDFASRIGNTAATFNARGTTDHGPAEVWFEYWKTATPANRQTTTARLMPGGVNGGPLSQRVTGLETGIPYTYRLCGQDTGGGSTLCAQTRNLVPGTDNVQAWGRAGARPSEVPPRTQITDIDIDASGPLAGHAFYNHWVLVGGGIATFGLGSTSDPNITCLEVHGDSAVVGLQTNYGDPIPPFVRPVVWVELFDLGPAGSGADRFAETPFIGSTTRSPADCSPLGDAHDTRRLSTGDISISQAESQPTLR